MSLTGSPPAGGNAPAAPAASAASPSPTLQHINIDSATGLLLVNRTNYVIKNIGDIDIAHGNLTPDLLEKIDTLVGEILMNKPTLTDDNAEEIKVTFKADSFEIAKKFGGRSEDKETVRNLVTAQKMNALAIDIITNLNLTSGRAASQAATTRATPSSSENESLSMTLTPQRARTLQPPSTSPSHPQAAASAPAPANRSPITPRANASPLHQGAASALHETTPSPHSITLYNKLIEIGIDEPEAVNIRNLYDADYKLARERGDDPIVAHKYADRVGGHAHVAFTAIAPRPTATPAAAPPAAPGETSRAATPATEQVEEPESPLRPDSPSIESDFPGVGDSDFDVEDSDDSVSRQGPVGSLATTLVDVDSQGPEASVPSSRVSSASVSGSQPQPMILKELLATENSFLLGAKTLLERFNAEKVQFPNDDPLLKAYGEKLGEGLKNLNDFTDQLKKALDEPDLEKRVKHLDTLYSSETFRKYGESLRELTVLDTKINQHPIMQKMVSGIKDPNQQQLRTTIFGQRMPRHLMLIDAINKQNKGTINRVLASESGTKINESIRFIENEEFLSKFQDSLSPAHLSSAMVASDAFKPTILAWIKDSYRAAKFESGVLDRIKNLEKYMPGLSKEDISMLKTRLAHYIIRSSNAMFKSDDFKTNELLDKSRDFISIEGDRKRLDEFMKTGKLLKKLNVANKKDTETLDKILEDSQKLLDKMNSRIDELKVINAEAKRLYDINQKL